MLRKELAQVIISISNKKIINDKNGFMLRIRNKTIIAKIIQDSLDQNLDSIIVVSPSAQLTKILRKDFQQITVVQSNEVKFLDLLVLGKATVLINVPFYTDDNFLKLLAKKSANGGCFISDDNKTGLLYTSEKQTEVMVELASQSKEHDLLTLSQHLKIDTMPHSLFHFLTSARDFEHLVLNSLYPVDIANKYQTFIFDLDGSLYLDGAPINNSHLVVNHLVKLKKNVFVLSNGSAFSDLTIAKKLQKIGFDLTSKNVINSTTATINYLIDKKLTTKDIFVFGTKDMKRQFQLADISLVEAPSQAEVVIVGNHQSFVYADLAELVVALQLRPESIYLATNIDTGYPLKSGLVWPDVGSLTSLIWSATRRKAIFMGKPKSFMIKKKLTGSSILFGDRIYTDIKMANATKIDSCLVLSGESTIADYEKTDLEITFVLANIGRIIFSARKEVNFSNEN